MSRCEFAVCGYEGVLMLVSLFYVGIVLFVIRLRNNRLLQHIPTRGYNITQSSAPDDGYMIARNMLSNYKEYKKWHLVGFSYLFLRIFVVLVIGRQFFEYRNEAQ